MMSFNDNWDVNKYREDHESEEHWLLRKAFMLKWKNEIPEERLVCLARVFTNMELMGCRYPVELMQEVARLSVDVAKQYRDSRKTKLQRTFVSASDAAEDRAKGIKREGGVIVDASTTKSRKINFVPQSQNDIGRQNEGSNKHSSKPINFVSQTQNEEEIKPQDDNKAMNGHVITLNDSSNNDVGVTETNISENSKTDINNIDNKEPGSRDNITMNYLKLDYISELSKLKCLNVQMFNERMFETEFGKFVLIVRPWDNLYSNITNSCISCKLVMSHMFKAGTFSITVNSKLLASARSEDKASAKFIATKAAWEKLCKNSVILFMKEQFVPQNDTRITMNELSKKDQFGTPIEDSVALKMMKLMGWKGGGLGADSQGIAEPIKPNLRMVNRAGLGHGAKGGKAQLKRAGMALLRAWRSDFDADLVFTAEFTSEERAILHSCASTCGLHSKSYGPKGKDRFLVISNKVEPFSLVRAVVQRGGETPKYKVFIPESLRTKK